MRGEVSEEGMLSFEVVVSERGIGDQNHLQGDPRGLRQVGRADPPLEAGLNHFAIVFERCISGYSSLNSA